jgi:hypothetical protein
MKIPKVIKGISGNLEVFKIRQTIIPLVETNNSKSKSFQKPNKK